ncbi:MAG: DUF6167 family protein [Actinomycetota bacterium]|nr:DUF6167 family protein [Actinomycetota bacterium]
MGRGLWFVAGAGTAIYGTLKARRLAYRLSASGLADQVAAIRLGAEELVADIRSGTRQREAKLVDELGLTPDDAQGPVAADHPAEIVTLNAHAVRKDP